MASRGLKKGFTTGAAAAAATRAALLHLLTRKPVHKVDIRCLSGEMLLIDIHRLKIISDNQAECIVIKDAGDDPDVTHKAEIGSNVLISELKESHGAFSRTEITNSDGMENVIEVAGGKGVGRVTKPGLEVSPGHPAINPGPDEMIREAVKTTLLERCLSGKKINVEIFVPEGEVLAKKTLNSRLGIIGGISILGTTGIVRPMSHDAYIATIKSSISVAEAMGETRLVFTTGRRSERFAMQCFPDFKEETFVQIGDFFKASLVAASASGRTKEVIITVFFGKAVKMAMGFPHTHAAKSELTLKKLSQWAMEITGDDALAVNIAQANTARHAFTHIHPEYPDVIEYVGKRIISSAGKFAGPGMALRVVIFNFEGSGIFDSHN